MESCRVVGKNYISIEDTYADGHVIKSDFVITRVTNLLRLAVNRVSRFTRICMPVKFPEISLNLLGLFFRRLQKTTRISNKACKPVSKFSNSRGFAVLDGPRRDQVAANSNRGCPRQNKIPRGLLRYAPGGNQRNLRQGHL